jgi:hypothetical protein
MLQVVYISTAREGAGALAAIIGVSQRNNARDGITGLLFANGKRFLQVLEGPAAKVDAALARIARDPRHRSIVTLSRREIAAPEFGAWSMTTPRDGEAEQAFFARVTALVAGASPTVRATFEGFAALKRAA